MFGTVIAYYAPLYMRGVGLSSAQVGWLGSLTLAFALVFQAVAAPITNRVGRKRTTLIGDLVSWTIPMFVWAFSRSFESFLVAAVLSASGRIVMVSWSLLVIEDVESSKRAKVFGILNMIVAGCGLLTPLVGYFITQYGVVPVLRIFYALGGVGMTVMFIWRNAITQETVSGQAAMTEHGDMHPWQSLRYTVQQVAGLHRHPGLSGVMVFYVLTIFIEQMSLFQILFLGETLRFGAGALSLVPVAGAVVAVVMYRLVRRLSATPAERTLVLARLLGLGGAVLLLLIPAGNLWVLLLAVSVLAAATFLTQTYRDAVLFSRLPKTGGADLYSAVQTLCLLCSIPAAGLAGLIFSAQPRLLFIVIAGLNLALLLLAVLLARSQKAA
ncbi:MFS transporter [Deinococcus altitudinis]|uniref:MFS transporter n=1 Tax=Deinococcus altitudinis TaxID=468914 RepID=UPI00389213E6